MPTFPSDNLFSQQWYLYNYISVGNYNYRGLDINVVNVWDDYTGRGVLVGVLDDGFDYTHYDLNNNYDTTRDYDSINQDSDPFPVLTDDNHGTAVAGIIAAEANGVGTVGVAFNAQITGIRAIPGSTNALINALSRLASFDVVNNSWGYTKSFVDNFYTIPQLGQAIANAAANGRNGLGTAIVFAAGNSREEGDNTNYHNFQNSRYVISVAALDDDGWATSYSTPGASILVSAFGSEYGSIVTTDRLGSAGYSYTDYTGDFNGTSAAAPQVSGVVALMLEANRNLGYRDIQEILAYSARRNDPNNYAGKFIWQYNGAKNWNGGGLHVSHDYGFGLVDALAAVRLAETWQTQSRFNNEQRLSYNSGNLGWTIPDNNTIGISHTFTVAAGLDVDWVEVELNLTHPFRGDLIVDLISPSGIISRLIDQPGNKEDDGDNIVFKLSSTQHWGESSAGNWTLRIKDLGPTDIGILNNWKLHLYGDADTVNDTYFYTNEYGIYGATTLTDSSGTDTINAAAITSNSYLNLNPGSTSTLNGTNLTISSGTVIENAFTGDGNDTIIGNTANNALNGGRGNDTLTGGAGNDTLNGGAGNNTLYGGTGNDRYVFADDDYITITEYANEGVDTVESFYTFDLGPAYLENLILKGTTAINGIGNTLNNSIAGNGANNNLNGGTGNDTLTGGGGNDTLIGGTGNDVLVGGTGNDTLTGGSGSDRFTFNSRSEGIDRITDFSVVDDTIYVSAAGFGGGLVAGAAIAVNQFFLGSAATTSSQRFLYDKGNGSLFFDQDGTGAIAKIQIATLNTGLSLTNADIFAA